MLDNKKYKGGDMRSFMQKGVVGAVLFGSLLVLGANGSESADFLRYKEGVTKSFQSYKEDLNREFLAYKKAQEQALREFKGELKQKWREPEVSSQYKWVEYSKDLEAKKSVDFKRQVMEFAVHAKSKQEAMKKFDAMLNETLQEDIKTATKKDVVEQKIAKILKKKQYVAKSQKKIIDAAFTKKEVVQLKEKIKPQKVDFYRYDKNNVYTIEIKLPSRVMAKNAMRFQRPILHYAQKEQMPASLIYAVIHSESAFNPLARSYVPAFGLMQIVPKTAGVDSYYYLYKKKRVLDASYLFVPENNIKLGSAYLHIIYYRYLSKITNPQSRIYCTIAAYNTGAGNVARAFTGQTNITKASRVINSMQPDEVYTHLLRHLPYDETKNYLKKVERRRNMYHKILFQQG